MLLNIEDILKTQNESDNDRVSKSWKVLQVEEKLNKPSDGILSIIEVVKNGHCSHFFTDGAWSLYELLIALIEVSGPAVMYASTYAMSETSTRCIQKLKQSGMIKQLHCLIDDRAETRSAASLQLLTAIADTCTLARTHAKVTVLEGAKTSVLILTSANYTENKRLECGIVLTDPTACSFHKDWILNRLKKPSK
jgi:hypothetical protein